MACGVWQANHRHLTAALIDCRNVLSAKRRVENEVLLPAGPKVALTGGIDFKDHRLIWVKLDKVHAKYPDMVLLHPHDYPGRRTLARRVPQV